MEERKPIQVSVQVPAGALDGFSRLVEQLRLLAAEVSGRGGTHVPPPLEQTENESFDVGRYEALRRSGVPQEFEGVRGEFSALEDAEVVHLERGTGPDIPEHAAMAVDGKFMFQLEETDSGGMEDISFVEEASSQVEQEVVDTPVVQSEAAEMSEDAAREEKVDGSRQEDIPVVQSRVDSPILDAPVVTMEPDSLIGETGKVWEEIRALDDTLPRQMTRFPDVEMAQSAGVEVSPGPAEVLSRWVGIPGEPALVGTAPQTAEAVSLAFRRDGRRYDNGFPLY